LRLSAWIAGGCVFQAASVPGNTRGGGIVNVAEQRKRHAGGRLNRHGWLPASWRPYQVCCTLQELRTCKRGRHAFVGTAGRSPIASSQSRASQTSQQPRVTVLAPLIHSASKCERSACTCLAGRRPQSFSQASRCLRNCLSPLADAVFTLPSTPNQVEAA
jgi:hypothetical protein